MGLFALAKLVIQIKQMPGNIPHDRNLVQDIAGMLFFLDLFLDKPLEHLKRGMVIFLHGKVDKPVDHPGHFLLVGIRIFEHFSGRCPFVLRGLDV